MQQVYRRLAPNAPETSHGIAMRTVDGGWEKHRRLANRALLPPKAVNAFTDDMNAYAKVLVNGLASESTKGAIDIRKPLNDYTFSVILKIAFGTRGESVPEIADAVRTLFNVARTHFLLPSAALDWEKDPLLRDLHEKLQSIRRFSMDMLKERREMMKRCEVLPRDFATAIFTARDEKDGEMLMEEDVLTDSIDIMAAGTDTTASLLTFALYELAKPENKMLQMQLYKEITDTIATADLQYDTSGSMRLMTAVLKETARLYPPAPINGRAATEDFEFHGVHIPRGASVVILNEPIHRNSAHYAHPNMYFPYHFIDQNINKARHPFAWIPFGAGGRSCVGQRISMMEAKVALAHLIRAFEIELASHRNGRKLETEAGFTIAAVEPVEIVFKARK
ncbi:uncharacterized protein SPPG_05745 [Spizellomyces punctatus DAOM BR117]|uniref:Cytochrome P450 n=1 Tax=Spizellomyces punctatus (strain DAOM BR117) TaxID=645134 RepID=A0A0L0HDG1_SPIPD|nr:uncharacterized protein SPPG_05745 [Spizellomyces punctatus DAOM BR117]KNC98763.1 hypothetical protein SPPG_05745 [Spizellomyces punctatus DAOM BR117]|eukprot:XP_016606803.1 hypothetical protein SPPG_05745 [Spizellomyces punctatus DAOM BR117]